MRKNTHKAAFIIFLILFVISFLINGVLVYKNTKDVKDYNELIEEYESLESRYNYLNKNYIKLKNQPKETEYIVNYEVCDYSEYTKKEDYNKLLGECKALYTKYEEVTNTQQNMKDIGNLIKLLSLI